MGTRLLKLMCQLNKPVTNPEVNLEKGLNKKLKLTFTGGFDFNWMNFVKVNLSIINSYKDDGIFVYPNPTKKYLNIESNSLNSSGEIQILSIDGKIVLKQIWQENANRSIDVSVLGKGIYILKAVFGSKMYTEKIIIE